MKRHFNIQLFIQRVEQPEVPESRTGRVAVVGVAPEHKPERVITNLLEVKVSADTEEEAYSKVERLLQANRPVPGATQG